MRLTLLRLVPSLSLLTPLACAASIEDALDGSTESSSESGSSDEVGSSESAGSESAGSESTESGALPGPCDALADGFNTDFDVAGTARSFHLDLPSGVDEGGPWAVVFAWHGLGDTAGNFHNLFAGLVDHPDMPFILVTPEDTDFPLTIPLAGTAPFDWDTFAVADEGVGNLEVELFDAVLACLDERWGVDAEHVHTAGFSLGGVTSDMLATTRGEQLAAVATWSGGYWNNPDNVGLALGSVVSWPELAVANPYPQLLVHGGPSDEMDIVPNLYTMSFYEFALSDHAFLRDAGHGVVVCEHPGGHTAPGSVSPATVIEFFAAHPLGVGSSPWVGEPPQLDGCTFDL
jgi:predicted esterase